MANLDRFKKLERARPDDSRPKRAEAISRFDGVGHDPAVAPGARRSGGQVERFASHPMAGGDAPLRLKEEDGGLSFVRCCRCKADNNTAAARCQMCGADISTEENRRFNEELFHAMEKERVEERRAAEELEATRRQAEATRREAEESWRAAERQLARRRLSDPLGGGSAWEVRRGLFGPPRYRLHLDTLIAGWIASAVPAGSRHLRTLLIVVGVVNLMMAAAFLFARGGFWIWAALVAFQLVVALQVWLRRRQS